jgi:hypothetical protein
MQVWLLLIGFSWLFSSCVDDVGTPSEDQDLTANDTQEPQGIQPQDMSSRGDALPPEDTQAPAEDTPETETSADAETEEETPQSDAEGLETETESESPWGDETWGETTKEPLVFAASDVSQETIDTTLEWIGVATQAWGQYGPLEIWIVGQSKDAVKELDQVWCDHHTALDPKWKTEWDCANGDPYGTGNGWSPFYNYVDDGGAAVSVFRRAYLDYHFQIITLSAKYPGPEEEDYRFVTLHEYFHVYQHAHIFDIAQDQSDDAREAKMGGKGKPWFAEGSAEYMAQLLYSRQPEASPGYLKERMQWKFTSVEAYKAYGKRLEELTYSDPVPTYDIGTWFIAYLAHKNGEEAVQIGFYQDVDALGFEGAFEKHLGQSPKDAVDEFDAFLELGMENALEILPTQ